MEFTNENLEQGSSSTVAGKLDATKVKLFKEILHKNQKTINYNSKIIKQIDCNQLAANSPIEDRMRISELNFKFFHKFFKANHEQQNEKQIICENEIENPFALAVFDGHNNELCADLINDRLFLYICLATYFYKHSTMTNNDLKNIKIEHLINNELEHFHKFTKELLVDYVVCPSFFHSEHTNINEKHLDFIKNILLQEKRLAFINFFKQLQNKAPSSLEDALELCFTQADEDVSNEIKRNITKFKEQKSEISNYYSSLAAGGACANLVFIYENVVYVAYSGDCNAILGSINDRDLNEIHYQKLSFEHNCRNENERDRIYNSHPEEEKRSVLKFNRLIGLIQPLRAFGDFCYKWKKQDIEDYLDKDCLQQAYCRSKVPEQYLTPPYLIVKPEITSVKLSKSLDNCEQKFIVLATDGLWEKFEDEKEVIQMLSFFKFNLFEKEIYSKELYSKVEKIISFLRFNLSEKELYSLFHKEKFDFNLATYLLINALGKTRFYFKDLLNDDKVVEQFNFLNFNLNLSRTVARSHRDDISVIVIYLN